MHRLFFFIFTSTFYMPTLFAQEVIFKVEVTADTLYFGNTLGIKYTIENTQGDFQPPEFNGFEIVGGPNVSSQFSMVNGRVTQSSTYEYYIVPLDIGQYIIDGAGLDQGDQILYSESVQLLVIDNPQGIRQSYRSYGMAKSSLISPHPDRKLSSQDSLKLKLKKIKSTKI